MALGTHMAEFTSVHGFLQIPDLVVKLQSGVLLIHAQKCLYLAHISTSPA